MILNLKILIVEDIPNTLAGTLIKLEDLGAQVECAESVFEAKKYLTEKKYDVLILDWRLPEKPGEDVNDIAGEILVEDLKSGKLGNINKEIPFIAVTAQRSVINYPKVKEISGCIDVIYKLYYGDIIKCLQKLSDENTF